MEIAPKIGRGNIGRQGLEMQAKLKAGAAALALICFATEVSAAACARPQDVMALRTAAVQQRLMVAALSCNAIGLYNDFVRAYQSELQDSDRNLRNYFQRNNSGTGAADYNAFKTKMANDSSMVSVGDMQAYCDAAEVAFDLALSAAKVELTAFVIAQPDQMDANYSACEFQLAGEMMPTVAPARAPLPLPKPDLVGFAGLPVVPAQGAGLRGGASE